jgi:hypothetical protein
MIVVAHRPVAAREVVAVAAAAAAVVDDAMAVRAGQ